MHSEDEAEGLNILKVIYVDFTSKTLLVYKRREDKHVGRRVRRFQTGVRRKGHLRSTWADWFVETPIRGGGLV